MKTIICLCLVCCFPFMAKAQSHKDSVLLIGTLIDSIESVNTNNEYNPGLPSILKSSNPIEIRFIYGPTSWQGYYSAVFISYQNGWKATYYFRESHTDTMISQDVSNKLNLDTFFANLVDNNIFSLYGNCETEHKKMYFNPYTGEFSGHGMGIGDGANYIIQFKVDVFFRQYNCYESEEYSAFYPYAHDLEDAANITRLFKQLMPGGK